METTIILLCPNCYSRRLQRYIPKSNLDYAGDKFKCKDCGKINVLKNMSYTSGE